MDKNQNKRKKNENYLEKQKIYSLLKIYINNNDNKKERKKL